MRHQTSRVLIRCCLGFMAVALVAITVRAEADTNAASVGKKIANFSLKDVNGKSWALKDAQNQKAVVVLFIGTQCPINNAYMRRLNELQSEYGSKSVQIVAINSNRHDTPERMAEHVKEHKLTFPVLKDEGNRMADAFGARRTPEAFVLDAQGQIRYQGRIDDQFGIGYQRPQPTRKDLVEAIEELLAGKPVTTASTPVAGCLIARSTKPAADGSVTFAKQVSRILQKNCQECHRPGQVGPMPLLTYDDASAWSAMIREVVQEKRMPPWYADASHGKFSNDRSLAAEESKTLLSWIEQGCPKGDDKDAPPAKNFPADWGIGKPDVVVQMPTEYTVPAKTPKGGVPYQYFVVPTNFKEDVWVQAVEARPGNRAVVHHIIVYVQKPGAGRQRGTDGIGEGFLGAYAPGELPITFGSGVAKKIPKGSLLVFQMHYTPNGVEQNDRSEVALIFAKEPPKHEARTRSIATNRFLIPPGDGNYEAISTSTFPNDILLLSFLPHMHLRGKDFEYKVIYPDGKTNILLKVPHYNFAWQTNYVLEQPLRLPAGTRIECTAHFDNSANNPNNPDPTKSVRWGDQTWEEMMIGFVDYVNLVEAEKKN